MQAISISISICLTLRHVWIRAGAISKGDSNLLKVYMGDAPDNPGFNGRLVAAIVDLKCDELIRDALGLPAPAKQETPPAAAAAAAATTALASDMAPEEGGGAAPVSGLRAQAHVC